jgi:hypothetical protein
MQQQTDGSWSKRVTKFWPYWVALLLLFLSLFGDVRFEAVMRPNISTTTVSLTSLSSLSSTINTTTTTSAKNNYYKDASNQNKNINRRVFHCGYEWPITRLFPDFNNSQHHLPWNPKDIHPKSTTEHDILVYGMHGPCPSDDIKRILQKEFAGKVLYINGESDGNVFEMIPKEWILDPINHPEVYRLFQIGPYPPKPMATSLDYNNITTTTTPTITTNISDLLFQQQHNQIYNQQSMQVFQMALYFSREMTARNFADNYQLRHINQNNQHHDHRYSYSYYQQDRHSDIVLNNTPLLEEQLVDHSKKPHNTKEYSAIVYLATKCQPHRQIAAQQLSTILPVHYGETCTVMGFNNNNNNNNTRPIPSSIRTSRNEFQYNDQLFRHYKYCLVMENTQQTGYMTEKLFNAYLGGCLPIYYGTHEVYQIFHRNSFIFYDIDQPNVSLDMIQLLEGNDTLYEEMLYGTPILLHGKETMDQYFSIFPEIANGSLNRKLREMMGMGELFAGMKKKEK